VKKERNTELTLNTHQENQFQLLVNGDWEQWEVEETTFLGTDVIRYLVRRMCNHTEHELAFEKIQELYKTKKLKL